MKASFFHDTPLIQGKDRKIYSRSFDYNVWKRYLSVFNSLIVTTRLKFDSSSEQNIIKNLKLSSEPNVIFKPVKSYQVTKDIIINRKRSLIKLEKHYIVQIMQLLDFLVL